jgi:hypothetical protein
MSPWERVKAGAQISPQQNPAQNMMAALLGAGEGQQRRSIVPRVRRVQEKQNRTMRLLQLTRPDLIPYALAGYPLDNLLSTALADQNKAPQSLIKMDDQTLFDPNTRQTIRLENPDGDKMDAGEAADFGTKMMKTYNADPYLKPYRLMRGQVLRMFSLYDQARDTETRGLSDASAIMVFGKILDELSVVREAEVKNIKAGQSLYGQLMGQMESISSGGLSPELRNAMFDITRAMWQDIQKISSARNNQYKNFAKKHGYPGDVEFLVGGADRPIPKRWNTTSIGGPAIDVQPTPTKAPEGGALRKTPDGTFVVQPR